MSNLKRLLVGMLVLAMLGLFRAPYSAAAQTGANLKAYDVTITNITNSKQALSPPILATHPASVHAWQMGKLASPGLELLAEEGMSDKLATEIKSQATNVVAAHTHLLPGDSVTLRIMAKEGDVLSAASMLIETNDGFTGLDGAPLKDGDMDAMAYDAGTEDNTELKADVPGPPFGGKNHGPDTAPHQPISMHPGITGKADVTPDFGWSGPVARYTVRAVDTSAAPSGTAYDVTVTNINNSMQGLSPLVIATHPASSHAWQMGQLASKGLEMLAEEGKPDMLASELKGVATDVATTHAHLLPGDSITVRVMAKPGDVLSAASMLIQTNDGFTGLDGATLADGASIETMAYDAGTEDNSELASDVPGPPFGGMNHGPDTAPHQPISMHPGITGKADVTPDFKWSGAVARFTVSAVPAAPTSGASATAGSDMSSTHMGGDMSGNMSGGTSSNMGEGSSSMPGMPDTGATNDGALWLLAIFGSLALAAGITLRRTVSVKR